jgi:hypothetical protein
MSGTYIVSLGTKPIRDSDDMHAVLEPDAAVGVSGMSRGAVNL